MDNKYTCGIDLIEISRIENAVTKKSGEKFQDRVFTPNELAYCQRHGNDRMKYESLAARWAAKEAFAKALGTGISESVRMNEIEVVSQTEGEFKGSCRIVLHGETKKYACERKVADISISLTHTETHAGAMCVVVFEI